MNLFTIMLFVIPIAAIAASVWIAIKKYRGGTPGKKAMRMNIATFLVLMIMLVFFAFSASAAESPDAVPTGAEVAAAATGTAQGMGFIAAALVTGLACIGGGIAVAAGAPAAIGAISEDPKVFGKAIIFVALGEAFALYGVVISFMIISKL